MGYLDNAGLAHLWGKVKSALAGKQDALTPDGSITLQGGGIGVALPTKSLSRAEYDAMTEAEKQAEAVYLVDEPAWEPVPLSIQEYDTDDGWHVRKWPGGYVEMWTTKEYTAPENMIFWEGWRLLVAAVPKNELPVPLTARLNENAFVVAPPSDLNNIDKALYGLLQTSKADLTHTCAYSFLASDNYLSRIITVSIAVTGRWK